MNDLLILKHNKNNEIRIELMTDSINMENSFIIEQTLLALTKKPLNLTLDMKSVKEITSSGIGMLLNIYQNSSDENNTENTWQIINVNDKILKILSIMNLDNILPIVRNEKL